jgi:glutaredoxin
MALPKRDICTEMGIPGGLSNCAAYRVEMPIRDKTSSAPNVVLYTRDGCHLCDEAEQVLSQHGVTPRLVDIDADPELQSRFDTWVPVVEIDGRVRFRGRIDPLLLKRILQRT